MSLATVRIPELPQNLDALSLADRVPLWVSSVNKTKYTTLEDLYTFFQTGGSGGYAPVASGSSIIYVVPESADGGTVAAIPSLAGKTFRLRRGGQPLIQGEEYEILGAGGFELVKEGDILFEGERFELDVYELQAGTPGSPTPVGGAGGLITGVELITTNTALNASHWQKLLQIRADNSIITVTLPSVEDVPENTVIIAETMITNNYQCTFATTGGQYIYWQNTGKSTLYMGRGEALWLLRADDGWYVINNFGQIYEQVGKVQACYKAGLNEVVANGALLQRSQYPRLWEWVQGIGASLVTDAVWNTASATVAGRTVSRPYRGCFSTGDGSTTFRVPDLMNVALRGVKSETGDDTERHLNKPGGFQRYETEAHTHTLTVPPSATSRTQEGNGKFTGGGDLDEPNPMTAVTTAPFGGAETRMDNVGVLWTIKC